MRAMLSCLQPRPNNKHMPPRSQYKRKSHSTERRLCQVMVYLQVVNKSSAIVTGCIPLMLSQLDLVLCLNCHLNKLN